MNPPIDSMLDPALQGRCRDLQRRPAPWNTDRALRVNNIDALRFSLATLVILAHSFALPVGNDTTEPLYRFSAGQRTMGGLAVDFFFILSGFLVTHSWVRDPRVPAFLRKRALRIYPAFIAATIVGNFLIAAPLSAGIVESLRSARLDELAWKLLSLRVYVIEHAFPDSPFKGVVNGSLWSISYEFWCYIGVMLLGLVPLVSKRRELLLGILIISIAISVLYSALGLKLGGGILGIIFGSPRLWARLLPCYLSGIVLYRYRDRIPWHPALLAMAVVALIAACKVPYALSVASPIAGAYLLLSLAFAPWLPLTRFGRYGDFSYGMYVYAFPIQQAIFAVSGAVMNTWLFFVASFALTLALAVPSWHLVERPVLRLKESRRSASPAAVTVVPEERACRDVTELSGEAQG